MLAQIATEMRSYMTAEKNQLFIRQQGFFKHARETEVLSKVIGVSDLYAWAFGNKVFEQIPPTVIKKTVAGNAKADKEQVAESLEKYVGKHDYAVDDESDAVAVGICWLLTNGYIDD